MMSDKNAGFDAESRNAGQLPPPVFSRGDVAKRRRVIRHDVKPAEAVASLETILRLQDPEMALSAWEGHPTRVAFKSFAADLRRELAPEGMLEGLLADRVILSAWRLQGALRAEEVWSLHEATEQHLPIPARIACEPLNNLRRDTARAEGSLRKALDTLARHRTTRSPKWGKADRHDPREAPRPDFDHDPDSRPASPSSFSVWPAAAGNPDQAPRRASFEPLPAPVWRDRLVYDFAVSSHSPVIKGTRVTVNHVVSEIVDGSTWAEILRKHPEMTENDIRVCLAYATESESLAV